MNPPQSNRKAGTHDLCQTPTWATEAMANFITGIWFGARMSRWHDPMCGQGYMVRDLRARGYDAHGTDILPLESQRHCTGGVDMFDPKAWAQVKAPDVLITNPPYTNSLLRKTLQKFCEEIEERAHMGALLVPTRSLVTQGVRDILQAHGYLYPVDSAYGRMMAHVLHFTHRVNFKMPKIGWTGRENQEAWGDRWYEQRSRAWLEANPGKYLWHASDDEMQAMRAVPTSQFPVSCLVLSSKYTALEMPYGVYYSRAIPRATEE